MNNMYVEKSKFLSYILRHKPEDIGLKLQDDGWLNINELVEASSSHKYALSVEDIAYIVKHNNKNRFAYSDDGLRIRASQGHSIKNIKINIPEHVPPQKLYHGTTTKYIKSILQQGLLPRTRHHVHLSKDIGTATTVGSRHGDPEILEIDSLRMYNDGYKFYLSENNVWLTEHVPVSYIQQMEKNNEHDSHLSI